MSKKQIQLIIDTDVGGDDLFCLCLILSQTELFRIHMITTVRGLRIDGKESVTRIKRLIKHFDYPYDVKVVVGDYEKKRHCFTEMDIVYKLHDEFFQGGLVEKYPLSWEDRLKFPKLNEEESELEIEASKKISDLLDSNPENYFQMLCIGPLVNISKIKIESLNRLERLVCMGGAVEKSNVFLESTIANKTPSTEWNWYICPKSVKKVLEMIKKSSSLSRILISTIEGSFSFPLIEGEFLFPVPEKLKEEVFSSEIEKIKNSKRKHFQVMKSLIFWNPISSLYDSVTAAQLINPKIINIKKMSVDVEIEEGKEGMSIFKDITSSEEIDSAICEVGYSFNGDEYVNTLKNIFFV